MTQRYIAAASFAGQPESVAGFRQSLFMANGPFHETPGGPSKEISKAKIADCLNRAAKLGLDLVFWDIEHISAWDRELDCPSKEFYTLIGAAVAYAHELSPSIKVAVCQPGDRGDDDVGQGTMQILGRVDAYWTHRREAWLHRAAATGKAMRKAHVDVYASDTMYYNGNPDEPERVRHHMLEFISYLEDVRRATPLAFLPCITTRATPLDWRTPTKSPWLNPWHMHVLADLCEKFADGYYLWHADTTMPWAEALTNETVRAALQMLPLKVVQPPLALAQ